MQKKLQAKTKQTKKIEKKKYSNSQLEKPFINLKMKLLYNTYQKSDNLISKEVKEKQIHQNKKKIKKKNIL